jgi:cAMP phosphodiesterase
VKITLVPPAVSVGGGSPGFFLTSYLIDEVVAIDAGGLGLIEDLSTQQRIEHIFITHSHIDHIASLPIFLDTIFQSGDRCVTVHAGAATMESLRRDVFNDRVWPDFIGMSEQGTPFVKLETLEPGRLVQAAGLRITPVAVDHVVPTLGFLVESAGAMVAIPSDTRPTDSFWREAGASPCLKAVFLEASFPNAMSELAILSGHLTPAMFAAEARKLPGPVPFVAVHIKPRFYEQVVAELNELDMPGLRIGRPGETYEF